MQAVTQGNDEQASKRPMEESHARNSTNALEPMERHSRGVVPFSPPFPYTPQRNYWIGDGREQNRSLLHNCGAMEKRPDCGIALPSESGSFARRI